MYVYIHFQSQVKTSHKKLNRDDRWLAWRRREKYSTKASPEKWGQGGSNLQQESLNRKSCKRYQDLEAFQKAQKQQNGGALLGSQVATPPAGKGEQAPMLLARWEPLGAVGSRYELSWWSRQEPVGSGTFKAQRSQRVWAPASQAGGGAGRFHSSQCSWAAVVSAVQARNHPGKWLLHHLKGIWLGESGGSSSHVLLGDRLLGRHRDTVRLPWARDSGALAQGLGRGRRAATSLPAQGGSLEFPGPLLTAFFSFNLHCHHHHPETTPQTCGEIKRKWFFFHLTNLQTNHLHRH